MTSSLATNIEALVCNRAQRESFKLVPNLYLPNDPAWVAEQKRLREKFNRCEVLRGMMLNLREQAQERVEEEALARLAALKKPVNGSHERREDMGRRLRAEVYTIKEGHTTWLYYRPADAIKASRKKRMDKLFRKIYRKELQDAKQAQC